MIKFLYVYLTSAMVFVESKTILTTSGYVRGILNHEDDMDYYSYKGIPYAEPPIADLRFKPPVPKTTWCDILDASKEGHVCPQKEGNYNRDQMSEDCLFLNIYVPANKTELLAVLAYVHGGEFKVLSGNGDVIYDPQLLLKRNIIVVTMNYRLGALGFLSLDIKEASGNAGIKDVLLALRWIKANIYRFGGDPDRITLGGNSAGAALAHYLTLTTQTTGLFQQAILISGSALGYRFLARHAKENALALGKELGFETYDAHEILQKLKYVNAFDIVEAQEAMGINNPRNGIRPFGPFVPCIEIENPSAIILEDPKEIITGGIPQNIPILAGFNSQEGIKMLPTINHDVTLVDNLNENFELCIPSNIEYPYGSYESRELARAIHQLYFNDTIISNSTLSEFVDLVRDTQFSYSIDSWIKLHKEREDSNVLYYYVFGFDGDLNWYKITNSIDFPGTSHADELGYLFATKVTKPKLKKLDSDSQRMLDIMLTLMTNFVKLGNPTPADLDNLKWPECGKERSHLALSDKPYPKDSAPIPDKLLFWYYVYAKYYEYLQNGGRTEKKIVP